MKALTSPHQSFAKRYSHTLAFSLIEVTLALGIAAFCLLTLFAMIPVALKTQQASIQQTTANTVASQIVADLSAALRLPPGLQSKQFNLHGHWAQALTPDLLYFAKDGTFVPGSTNQRPPPPTAVFLAAVTYLQPPTETTSLADVTVGWPAAGIPVNVDGQPDFSKGAGKVETFAAINR
jgi:type II secretory pathway pseudopilin PulG